MSLAEVREDTYLDLYVPKEWTFIAGIDESEPYEIDVTEIWSKPGNTFMLVTASGCSCWDGDYEAQEFDSINEIKGVLLTKERDKYSYNPSVLGLKVLIEKAEEVLASKRMN